MYTWNCTPQCWLSHNGCLWNWFHCCSAYEKSLVQVNSHCVLHLLSWYMTGTCIMLAPALTSDDLAHEWPCSTRHRGEQKSTAMSVSEELGCFDVSYSAPCRDRIYNTNSLNVCFVLDQHVHRLTTRCAVVSIDMMLCRDFNALEELCLSCWVKFSYLHPWHNKSLYFTHGLHCTIWISASCCLHTYIGRWGAWS